MSPAELAALAAASQAAEHIAQAQAGVMEIGAVCAPVAFWVAK